MPKIVEVPNVGNVEFPDNMPDNQISMAIQKQYGPAKSSFWTNPQAFLQSRAADLRQEAQRQVNMAEGVESEGRGLLNRFGHRVLSLVPETAAVVDEAAAGLMDPKNAAALAAGVVDPAIPAAYFGSQALGGLAGVNQPSSVKQAAANPSPENVQQVLMQGAQLAGAGGAAGAPQAGAVARGPAVKNPIADSLNKSRGTVPAEAATPAELKAYADANGIPINAAQATEHNFPRNLQSVGERATVGGTAVRKQAQAAQGAIAEHAQRMMDQFSPNTPDVASAGATIKRSVQAALDKELLNSRQYYAAVDKAANGATVDGHPGLAVRVDLKPLKAEAQDILSSSSFVRANYPTLDLPRTAKIARDIANGPDSATFSEAQATRSRLIQEELHPENAISDEAQAWLKRMSGSTDKQMIEAAKTEPGLQALFRSANDHWKGLQEDFNSPRSPLNQILKEPDPSKVPQKMMQQGQIGGSPYNVGLLDRYGIDKGPVKWTIVGDMIKKDFGLQDKGKTLGGYSDDFLRKVFTPEELAGVYKTGAIARSTRLNVNPSGTAGVEQAAGEVRNPIKAVAHSLAAKATNSELFNQWLLKNPQPAPSAGTAAMRNWLSARFQQMKALGITTAAVGGEGQGNQASD